MEAGPDILNFLCQQRCNLWLGRDVSTGIWRSCSTIRYCKLSILWLLTIELWHGQWTVWMVFRHFKCPLHCDQRDCNQIWKAAGLFDIEPYCTRFCNWIHLLCNMGRFIGHSADWNCWAYTLRDPRCRHRCRPVLIPAVIFNGSYFVHQRGARFAAWILAIATSSSISAIVCGYIIQSMGWPATFKICMSHSLLS